MSSLLFTQAPPCPLHIDSQLWESEWIGMQVGLASTFPQKIGYLGVGNARVFDEKKKGYCDPTPSDSMNFSTQQLSKLRWVSRGSLIYTCKYSTPELPTILAWLDEDDQKVREVFAVPESIAEYLP